MKLLVFLFIVLGRALAADIHDAVAIGELDRISALVKQDAKVLTLPDTAGDQPLHLAAQARKVEALELLIRLGADVNATNRIGLTPLHITSKNGPTDAVELLIKAGAKADAKDAAGRTPLDVAAHDLIRQRIKAAATAVSGASEFFKAVESGQIATMDALLARNPDLIKAVDASGNTALIKAVSTRKTAIVKWLLEHGFAIDTTNRLGETALHHACALLDEALVTLLLQAGADANAGGDDIASPLGQVIATYTMPGERAELRGDTATDIQARQTVVSQNMKELQKAVEDIKAPAYTGKQAGLLENITLMFKKIRAQKTEVPKEEQAVRLRIARLLLDHKASPDKSGPNQVSALMIAASNSDPAGLKLLLEHGADVNAQGPGGITALGIAIYSSLPQSVDTLLDAKSRTSPRTILSALGTATMTGDKAMLRHVLDRTRLPRYEFAADQTLASLTGRNTDPEIVRLLLDSGVKPDGPGQAASYGPLHWAAAISTPEVLELLIDAGATLDKKDKEGFTPLHCAAEVGHIVHIRILIEHGASVSAPALDGRTPLHSAAQLGYVDVLRLLVKHNAPVDAREQNNATPLIGAALEGWADAVEFLLSHGADPNVENKLALCALDATTPGKPVLPVASAGQQRPRDYGRCVDLLVKAGARVEREVGQKRWWTPLSHASENGVLPVVEALLRHGARTDNAAKDPQGRKPLHYAAFKGHVDVVKALLKAGAKDGPTKTINGNSAYALHFAAVNNHVGVIQALLDGGTNINARNAEQTTPLMWAASQGRIEAATLLLQRGADLHAAAQDGTTALQIASRTGQSAMVDFLRRSDAKD